MQLFADFKYTYTVKGGGNILIDPDIQTFFDRVYDDTYSKTLYWVTKKCGNAHDIADILQETYTELFTVLLRKGVAYISNAEAFVIQIARSKVYRHYSAAEKLKLLVPLFSKNEDGMEVDITDFEEAPVSLEDGIITRLLLEQIADFITKKPDDIQKIFHMYYVLDITTRQIAKALSMNESTVKSKIRRTTEEIRQIYRKDNE
jgi:RNA polymerase sigma-70 factor (ECF subfamily)